MHKFASPETPFRVSRVLNFASSDTPFHVSLLLHFARPDTHFCFAWYSILLAPILNFVSPDIHFASPFHVSLIFASPDAPFPFQKTVASENKLFNEIVKRKFRELTRAAAVLFKLRMFRGSNDERMLSTRGNQRNQSRPYYRRIKSDFLSCHVGSSIRCEPQNINFWWQSFFSH